MTIFFTSDLHFGHKKLAAIRFGYEEVPDFFTDYEVRRHDEILCDKWCAAVKKDDIVYVQGDISSGSTSGQLHALETLKKLPGRKRLIKGNHDRVHDMYRDCHAWEGKYREVFEAIQLHGRRRISLRPISEGGDGGHVDVLLSHFPYQGDHTATGRYQQWRLPDHGLIVLHGHTHSDEKVSYAGSRGKWTGDEVGVGAWITVKGTPQIHIGVDAWDGNPVPLEEIQTMVRALEAWRE